MENLGQKIRKRRQELDLKVYELAKKAGVNPVYITQIEKHNKLPSLKILKGIVDNLGDANPRGYFLLYMRTKYPESYQIIRAAMASRTVEEKKTEVFYDDYAITKELCQWLKEYLVEAPPKATRIKIEKLEKEFTNLIKEFTNSLFDFGKKFIKIIKETSPQDAKKFQLRLQKHKEKIKKLSNKIP
ncbi:MAG: helix-turn-helix domain-containing protein [Planctomycetota bacterium]|jgi:transcriptional regulator with XRE-family HTH domain